MEVKSFTYKQILNSYYLPKWFDKQKMEDHIVEMVQQGWEILTPPMPGPKGPSQGLGLPGNTMIAVFKKG